MDDSRKPPPIDRLADFVAQGASDEADAILERVESAPVARRKDAVKALRADAERRPDALEPLLPRLAHFLTDEDRASR